ncbi:hypothetical protein Bsp3421_000446 (plasmid) [Burkholderia sp. FERM BP-3421]|jgi:hypothetical protein|uniref:hypothetical protein n=1 Tax=Burkholderia sp. FERM BP-3421 TaxID=1494466 RepID=UPI00235E16DF|nr:hypothetical protein [Burkholderia sp. FERM BP-3421]WDD90586.1 hypothetical protein Bsp3421_000446 [Burkholderia sp. FERM BP-3421]
MSVQFKPGLPAGACAAGVAGSRRAAAPDAAARRFADCLTQPRDEHAARDGDDEARRRRLSVAHAAAARLEPLDGRPGATADALSWRLTGGRFAGLVVQARVQHGTLIITLIPANAGQRARAARHRARIEAACAARFAGPTVVTWRDATDPA